jgi:hypothetical protein
MLYLRLCNQRYENLCLQISKGMSYYYGHKKNLKRGICGRREPFDSYQQFLMCETILVEV